MNLVLFRHTNQLLLRVFLPVGMDKKEKNSKNNKEELRQPTTSFSPPASPASAPSDDDEAAGGQSPEGSSKSKSGSSHKNPLDYIQQFLSSKLHISLFDSSDDEDDKTDGILKTVDYKGLVEYWKEKGFKKIITAVGAGISTSAGIPDFRSPSTGLYHNLQKYNLPYPTAIFELEYFLQHPEPFFRLAKELYPGVFKPTPCHYFVRLLHEKGLLLRHYTQNIDCLERVAGIPEEKIVEAHGTFYSNHCTGCKKAYTMEWVKEQIFADNVPTCTSCNSVVKPDIVFFGENLPERFYQLTQKDFDECDLLIIIGSSLEVQPFASLISLPKKHCVRLLINRNPVGHTSGLRSWFTNREALRFDQANNKRDIAWFGECDDGIRQLAREIGWETELQDLIKTEHDKIDELSKRTDGLVEKAEEKLEELQKEAVALLVQEELNIHKTDLKAEKEIVKLPEKPTEIN